MQAIYFFAVSSFVGITWHPWKIVGMLGMLTFTARFFIQWIASEKAGKSIIPFGFWECSALGSTLMLCYFAIYQKDPVGVLQNIFPLPIYLRNIYFRYRHKTPKHPGNVERPPE